MKYLVKIIAIISSFFVIFSVSTRYFSDMENLGVYLASILSLTFLSKPLSKTNKFLKLIDYLLSIISIVVGFYSFFFAEEIASRIGDSIPLDIYLGVVAILLVLEATRRVTGWAIVVLCILFLGYAYFGKYFPEIIATKGFSTERISSTMYLSLSGIYGIPLKVMFDYIVLFILFGSFLEATGGVSFFLNLAISLGGRFPGGLAQISVISSGLMGMISGSAVANVATTGAFTIPTMKKGGYEPNFAGAVETVASTGGQLMPPVMGAAAFVMADYIGVPYASVCMRALVPALMYYFILGLNIYFYAQCNNLYGMSKEEIPQISEIIKKQGFLLIPIILLIICLAKGYSPTIAALSALIGLLIICWFRRETRLDWSKAYEALQRTGMAGVQVGVPAAAAGVILGVFMLTGLGTKIASVLIQISAGSVFILLIISMLTSIIFGMGLPTTPCYILLATLIGPALTEMGIPKILAHLFLFYFGMLSMITPPVAMAAYAAAAISGGSFYKTGFLAWKMGLPIFIIPYFFVYYPGFALIGSWFDILHAIFIAFIGLSSCTIAIVGYFKGELQLWERIILIIGGLGLIHKGLLTDLIGIGIIFLFLFLRVKRHLRLKMNEKIGF